MIDIPNRVTSISDDAFKNCTALTDVMLPSSVFEIGAYAFSGCSSLIGFTIPARITKIEVGTWAGCVSLKEITFHDKIQQIGAYAFKGCTGLTAITSQAVNPPKIADDTFLDVDKSIPLYVPQGSVESYRMTSYWSEFDNIKEYLSAVEKIETEGVCEVVGCNGVLLVKGVADDAIVTIHALGGTLLYSTIVSEVANIVLPHGIYLVQVGHVVEKVLL